MIFPHLLFPVATETSEAIQYLEYALEEMEKRFKILASEKVRNIQSYNEKNISNKLPYLVIIIDEFADLMYTSKKDIEIPIIRIAQKARAVGIHLILATQRPSVNIITGILKANIPTRIAFKVASQIDARTILDNMGAEKLLGSGEMLLKSNESEDLKKIQGCFLSDLEVEIIVNTVIANS
jgi:DNA segregation ATPase FtsK/SpoIIIE, S-DNA-T family